MKKGYVVATCLVVAAVILVSFLAISISNEKKWVKLYSWSTMIDNVYVDSDCNFTTNQFTITSQQWRITWNTGGEAPSGSHFDIKVYDDSVGSNMIKEISSVGDENASTWTESGAYFFNDTSTFHLQVFIVGGLPHWTFEIDEWQ